MGIIKDLLEGLAIGFGIIVGMALALYCLTHIPYIEEFAKSSFEVLNTWLK